MNLLFTVPSLIGLNIPTDLIVIKCPQPLQATVSNKSKLVSLFLATYKFVSLFLATY